MSVLTGPDHPYAGGCGTDGPALRGVWFSPYNTLDGPALVVNDVSPNADPLPLHLGVQQLNECTRPHHLSALPRPGADRGRALAAAVTVSQ